MYGHVNLGLRDKLQKKMPWIILLFLETPKSFCSFKDPGGRKFPKITTLTNIKEFGTAKPTHLSSMNELSEI